MLRAVHATLLLGTAMAIALVVCVIADTMYWRPFKYDDADRLFLVARAHRVTSRRSDLLLWSDIAKFPHDRGMLQVLTYRTLASAIRVGDRDTVPAHVIAVSDNTLGVLGVTPILGGLVTHDDQHVRQAFVGEHFWETHLDRRGDSIGTWVRADGGPLVMIVGVLPRSFTLPRTPRPDLCIVWPDAAWQSASFIRAVVRLADGRTQAETTASLNVAEGIRPAAGQGVNSRFVLVPISWLGHVFLPNAWLLLAGCWVVIGSACSAAVLFRAGSKSGLAVPTLCGTVVGLIVGQLVVAIGTEPLVLGFSLKREPEISAMALVSAVCGFGVTLAVVLRATRQLRYRGGMR